MKKNILILLLLVGVYPTVAQIISIDPALTAAVGITSGIESSGISDMKSNQQKIIAAQTATTALVNKINEWQQKTYNGLRYVSTAVKNAYQLVRCYKVLQSIYDYQQRMLTEAKSNPLALLFAYKVEENMVIKAVGFYSQIHDMILKEGDDLLMDSGDRTKLMYNLLTDLQVIEGYSAAAYYKVHWVVIEGIVKSLNPFNQFVNNDANIVKDILNTWKF